MARRLRYRDMRTVKKWASRNGFTLYSDGPHGSKYMSRIQFIYAQNEPLIRDLQEKYNERWIDVFEAHMKVDVKIIIAIEELKRKTKIKKFYNYKLSQRESNVLSRLTGKSSEL